MNSAAILDRDGVLLVQEDGKYILNVREARFESGALDGLVALDKLYDHIIIITNQACVGKGLTTTKEVEKIHDWIWDAARRRNVTITQFYTCCHKASDDCNCRKPRPGLLRTAMRDWNIDPAQSVVVGDTISDMEMAFALGFKPVLVLTGKGKETRKKLKQSGRLNEVTIHQNLFDFARDLNLP